MEKLKLRIKTFSRNCGIIFGFILILMIRKFSTIVVFRNVFFDIFMFVLIDLAIETVIEVLIASVIPLSIFDNAKWQYIKVGTKIYLKPDCCSSVCTKFFCYESTNLPDFKKVKMNIIARELFITELTIISEDTLDIIQKNSSFQFDEICRIEDESDLMNKEWKMISIYKKNINKQNIQQNPSIVLH